MIFKRILLLMCVLNLGACASLSSIMPSENAEDANKENVQENTAGELANNENTEASDATQAIIEKPSEAALIALELTSQSDLYTASKRTLTPSAKTKVLNVLAQFTRGENEASLTAINAVLASELNLSSAVYVLAGDIAAANADRIQATQHYKNALKVNEYNAKAANRLGMMARANGEFELAEALYSQAVNARPASPEAYRNRAVLYDLYLNQKEKALQDYQAYSALLEHQLNQHKAQGETLLSEAQTKALKRDIKLGKRWLVDVGRQVTALARTNNAGGE